MELDATDVVFMSGKGELAFFGGVVPHFDGFVVSAGNEEGLVVVEVDAADWAVMLNELIDEHFVDVVVEKNFSVVKRGKDPWEFRVKCDALDSRTLSFIHDIHFYIFYFLFFLFIINCLLY